MRAELEAYAPLVSPGSYIVATDGIMLDLADVPRGQPGWTDDHPRRGRFAARHLTSASCKTPPFNESRLGANITHWPGRRLQRVA